MGILNEYVIYEKALADYGQKNQQSVAIEEMSELTKEIVKNWRGEDNLDHIAEEIADVEIMLEQLKLIYGCNTVVSGWKARKLARLARRCHLI